MPIAPPDTHRIKDLDQLNNAAKLLDTILEAESASGVDKNYKVTFPTLIQTVANNLPGTNRIKSAYKAVRTYDTQSAGYQAGFETLVGLDSDTLCVGSLARVELPVPSRDYILVSDPNGSLYVFPDGAFIGQKVSARWVEKNSYDNLTASIQDFNPFQAEYDAGDNVKYTIAGSLRIFSAKVNLVKTTFGNNQIPVPTGLLSDASWTEISPESAPNFSRLGQLVCRFYSNAERTADPYPFGDTVEDLIARENAGASILYDNRLVTVALGPQAGTYRVTYNPTNPEFDAWVDGSFVGGRNPCSFVKVSAGTAGAAVTNWMAGPQTANSLVVYNGNIYRVKQDIANSQAAPDTNAQYYQLLNADVTKAYVDAADASLLSVQQQHTQQLANEVVHRTGDETVNGIKTFNAGINAASYSSVDGAVKMTFANRYGFNGAMLSNTIPLVDLGWQASGKSLAIRYETRTGFDFFNTPFQLNPSNEDTGSFHFINPNLPGTSQTSTFLAISPKFILVRNGVKLGVNTDTPTELVEVGGNVKANYFIGDGSLLTNLPGGSGGGVSQTYVDAADAALQSKIDTEKDRIDTLVTGAPQALDTLKEIADQLAADEAGTAAILATQQQHTQQLANVVHRTGDETANGVKRFPDGIAVGTMSIQAAKDSDYALGVGGSFAVVQSTGADGEGAFRLQAKANYAGIQATKVNITDEHILTLNADGGNVGIATKTPTEKLEVVGNVKAAQFIGDGSRLTNLPAEIQYYNRVSDFPATGVVNTLYIATTANKTYRYDGTAYQELSKAPVVQTLGTSTTNVISQSAVTTALGLIPIKNLTTSYTAFPQESGTWYRFKSNTNQEITLYAEANSGTITGNHYYFEQVGAGILSVIPRPLTVPGASTLAAPTLQLINCNASTAPGTILHLLKVGADSWIMYPITTPATTTGGGAGGATIYQLAATTIINPGTQTITLPTSANAIVNLTVLEANGYVRTIWIDSYSVAGTTLNINTNANLKPGDKIAGSYY